MCGLLDNLDNKLCLPYNIECPINFITTSLKDISKYNYKITKINEYTSIYYTNDFSNEGIINDGFFVDTDLMIKYPEYDSEIYDTGSIKKLLNSHSNKLYKDSLAYDPYESWILILKELGI